MKTDITVVVHQLRLVMGDFAERFVATELGKINKRYVIMEPGGDGYSILLPNELPQFVNGDLEKLLKNITEALTRMIGAHYSELILARIENALNQ